jgi:hypothetical protein
MERVDVVASEQDAACGTEAEAERSLPPKVRAYVHVVRPYATEVPSELLCAMERVHASAELVMSVLRVGECASVRRVVSACVRFCGRDSAPGGVSTFLRCSLLCCAPMRSITCVRTGVAHGRRACGALAARRRRGGGCGRGARRCNCAAVRRSAPMKDSVSDEHYAHTQWHARLLGAGHLTWT